VYKGNLGVCNKTAPSSPSFSGDLMTAVCLCRQGDAKTKVLSAHFLDSSESPRNVMDVLWRLRNGRRPRFIVYDNACHLRHSAMARYPHLVFRTVFLSDKFHWPNHTACSKLYDPKQWSHIDVVRQANTAAMEQYNVLLKRHLSQYLSFCNAVNAMNILELFLSIHNNACAEVV